MPTPPTTPVWNDDLTQFARLLDEANAVGAFTPEVMADLAISMDLPPERIAELIDRAGAAWATEKAARHTDPTNFTSTTNAAPWALGELSNEMLTASLRQLDNSSRERLAQALETLKAEDIEKAIVNEVRTMTAALYPELPVRGVLFRYGIHGDVLFENGDATDDISFKHVWSADMPNLLGSVYDRAGGSPMIAVDLREETVAPFYRLRNIYRVFGEVEPD